MRITNDDLWAPMHRALAQDGHSVVGAGSGDTAAALIKDAVPFDVLVTDIRMPGSRDGVALMSCWHEGAGLTRCYLCQAIRAPTRPGRLRSA